MHEFLIASLPPLYPASVTFADCRLGKFDGRGNYTFGVNDQAIFPEIELEKVKRTQGMDITIVTTAGENAQAHDLLKMMGFPFSEK